MEKSLWSEIKKTFLSFVVETGPEILYAVAALVAGIFIIKGLMWLLKSILRKTNLELSLKSFVESLSIFVLYGLLFFIIGLILGIKTSSFLAIFGAAGIAIGLALQGSLSNFAGGVLILVFKPFRVKDLIEVNSNLGFVQKINILYTQIKTLDGRWITMPNRKVSNNDIDNRTREKHRRIELDLKFSLNADIENLRHIISQALKKHPKLIENLPVQVWLFEIGDYQLKLKARFWVLSENYRPVLWEQLEAVKKALDENGIEIPIPKQELYKGTAPKANQAEGNK